MKHAYANEIFPWAGFDPALTYDRLIRHRWTMQREKWAKVLGAPIEDLVETAIRIEIVSPENNATTQDVLRGFYRFIIQEGLIEELFCYGKILPKSITLSGYLAGRKAIP